MTTDHPNPTATIQTLRFRLRGKTQDIHRRLDANLNSLGLMRNRESYLAVLEGFLGLYGPLERQLAMIPWSGSGIDFNQRCKAHWLQEDLQKLGLQTDYIAGIPDCEYVPKLSSVPEGLGALYVMEGATLGGQVITRRIRSNLNIDAETGGRFFAAYGDRTGSLWSEFVAALDRYGQDSETSVIIEATAVSTFRCFENWTKQLISDEEVTT